jgi:acetylornithine/N-succinyldiaminopimelate aminotransferase
MNSAVESANQRVIDLFDQYVIPNYRRFPVTLVRGEGSFVWDVDGRRYLDLFPGWGCNILGYSPPRVVEAIQRQAEKLIHVPNTWYMEQQGLFAEFLCTRSFGKAFFCNSGAEANEAAIKLARLHGSQRGRYRMITFENGFHGRTLGALTATAQPKYHEGLGPLMAGFRYSAMNDLDQVKSLVDDETCAIMIEPVQGEGGVRIPDPQFLQALRTLCDQNDMLLIFDEVQTGMGRTGTWFGYQQTDVQPDVITMAKGLAGGVACGALICSDEIATDLRPGMHASTFGGNSLAMAAGLATGQTIEEEDLLSHVNQLADKVRDRLHQATATLPCIDEIRICGMMIGIQLSQSAASVVGACMDRGLLVNVTNENVIRLLPALNVTEEQLMSGIDTVLDVVRSIAESE